MITKADNVAIVGASEDSSKYGYEVSRDLISRGINVFLVNSKGGKILEKKVYKKLSDIPESIDIVLFTTPPKITVKALKEVDKLGIRRVWMQPGSENDKVIEFCRGEGIEHSHNAYTVID